jgi:predicted Zn-dependent peptidase
VRRFALAIFCALACAASAAVPSPAVASQPRMLPDSTVQESWTLSNGLRVVTRTLPGARTFSVAVSYRAGRDDDPADRPGLAALLGEVMLTAPAGTFPARTRAELESLRPLGWSMEVGPHFSTFVEACTARQAPGILRQAAIRMRGVTVTEAALKPAVAAVKSQLAAESFGSLGDMLRHQIRALAAGGTTTSIAAAASGRALDRITVRDVQQALARDDMPANAVLAVAGDLGSFDFHALIEREFAVIPGGVTAPPHARVQLDTLSAVMVRSEAMAPLGVVGLIAPALSDSLYPSFFLSMLMLGTHVMQSWGPGPATLRSRFQFSVLDDPGLVRFYPPVEPGTRNPGLLGRTLQQTLDQLLSMTILRNTYEDLAAGVQWIVGGPMTEGVRRTMLGDPASLNLFTAGMATRAQWGDEEFWTTFRRRMNVRVAPGLGRWVEYIVAPEHQARLLILPR